MITTARSRRGFLTLCCAAAAFAAAAALPAPAPSPRPTRAEDVAEHVAKDVTEIAAAKTTGTAAHAGVYPGVAEAVIGCPFLLVHQDVVGLGGLLELAVRVRVIGVAIRVVLLRQPPEG